MRDIAEEILLRLPVKSLVRCKLLSKDLGEFISRNPSFRKRYIERNRGCSFMLGFHITKHIYLVHLDGLVHFLPTYNKGISLFNKRKRDNNEGSSLQFDEPLKKKRGLEQRSSPVLLLKKSPNFFGDPAVRVLGSSNGFLLCSLDPKCPLNYIIINPISKLCVSLPVASASSISYTHGFICSSTSPQLDTIDYYKVVRGISPKNWSKKNPLMLEIISSDSSQWSSFKMTSLPPFLLDCITPSAIIISETGVVYVPGTVYKQARGNGEGLRNGDKAVIIFDESKVEPVLRVEKFPPTEDILNCDDLFGESENLILYARREPGRLKIWTTNVYEGGGGWTLIRNLSLESWLQIYPEHFKCAADVRFYIRGFHPTNKNVIFVGVGAEVESNTLVYDMEKSNVETFSDTKTQGWNSVHYFFPYTCGLIGPHLFLCD
ncbi:hypothetical protein ACHQM5_004655 [Ranunculus cassubicifolius]